MIPGEKMFVDRTDDISELEKDQKNKWQWRWLEDPDSHGDYFSTYVCKLREYFYVKASEFCTWF